MTSQPLAFLNGDFIRASQLHVQPYDAGFVLGATVTEQMRTFGGKLFRLAEHLDRLAQSLDLISLDLGDLPQQFPIAAAELVSHNHGLLPAGGDLGLCLFITPGPYAGMAPPDAAGPTVAMHTYPLKFATWANLYTVGQALRSTDVIQHPPDTMPPALKCRSRMHYYLADQQARNVEPGARAVMLDQHGFVTEATTANLLAYRKEQGLISPPADKILPGISVATTQELAASLGIPFQFADLTVDDLIKADEVLVTSTSVCIVPVTKVNGKAVANGEPGPTFHRLMDAWSARVGVDIIAQATSAL